MIQGLRAPLRVALTPGYPLAAPPALPNPMERRWSEPLGRLSRNRRVTMSLKLSLERLYGGIETAAGGLRYSWTAA